MEAYRVPVAESDRLKAGLAMSLAAVSTDVPVEAMRPGERLAARACRARWLAMYLAHTGLGWPLERVGHAFGLNRATVGMACRWAEDARDRPGIDDLLDRLETVIRALCDGGTVETRLELTS